MICFLQVLLYEIASTRHMEYVTKFIKKNPKIMSPAHLRQILKHPGRPINPVYEAIGGIEWIEDNVTTARQDNAQSKQCRVCGVREPVKTLFRCSGCRHIYYWFVVLLCRLQ